MCFLLRGAGLYAVACYTETRRRYCKQCTTTGNLKGTHNHARTSSATQSTARWTLRNCTLRTLGRKRSMHRIFYSWPSRKVLAFITEVRSLFVSADFSWGILFQYWKYDTSALVGHGSRFDSFSVPRLDFWSDTIVCFIFSSLRRFHGGLCYEGGFFGDDGVGSVVVPDTGLQPAPAFTA